MFLLPNITIGISPKNPVSVSPLFCPLGEYPTGHVTTFCPLEGHPRGHFIVLSIIGAFKRTLSQRFVFVFFP